MKLAVALDLESFEENLALVKELCGKPLMFKVGLRSYLRDGYKIIEEIKKVDDNFEIFLDLKLYDIPNTMADAVEVIASLGVDLFTVHASSGKRALLECRERIERSSNKPLMFAVTALTSFDDVEFQKIYGKPIEQKALELALEAKEGGSDGVVCSVYESKEIKEKVGEILTLTPGIRPFESGEDDQRRVANIDEAKKAKSDIIVVGRPIYKSNNPKESVEKILEMMN